MERPLLISVILVGSLACAAVASADCAQELARLTEAAPDAAASSGEGEDMDGGAFATFGQEGETQSEGSVEAAKAHGGDRAAALEKARLALDAGDEAGCMRAIEEAKAM